MISPRGTRAARPGIALAHRRILTLHTMIRNDTLYSPQPTRNYLPPLDTPHRGTPDPEGVENEGQPGADEPPTQHDTARGTTQHDTGRHCPSMARDGARDQEVAGPVRLRTSVSADPPP